MTPRYLGDESLKFGCAVNDLAEPSNAFLTARGSRPTLPEMRWRHGAALVRRSCSGRAEPVRLAGGGR